MTQIDELVKRARERRNSETHYSATEYERAPDALCNKLADALEAQAKRNAELEKENERLREQREQLSKAVDGVLVVDRSEYAKARIASLEATVREMREAIAGLLATPEIADADPRDKDEETQIAERKARAALASSESVVKSEGKNDGRD